MNHRIRIKKICLECKCPFEVYAYRKNTAKFCSIVCMNKSMLGKHYSISTEFKKGQIAHNYKGLRLSHSGRNVITFKGKVRYAYRYLIEKLLKRKLSSTEHIHHKDNDKENDEILNFLIFDNGGHRKFHNRAYNYLVRKGLIEDYMEWSKVEYGKTWKNIPELIKGGDAKC